ncbi:RNA polymerase sigma factor (possible RNA polymerase sigma-24 factor) [Pedobacter sp. BAL39]|uniref:RNA polymerase sigma-70 factor n=1 Tax=Pedobacter sp. BAL39 TaxID=391596 RepID=UPI000155981C|nr:RNA polymerase sigma-70 factor [Pedobacter sp. BAL39]EDM36952.1 RNA polymerase sigma factor (possible RNA polymerase sigma-24 factor) [Pedobacter sp. BAL39]
MDQNQHFSSDQGVFILKIDEERFEHAYRTCWKDVYGIIFHYTRDEEIAEEVSQDIFASLWERRKNIEIRTSIERYLYRAAKLESFEYLRTSSSHRTHLQSALSNAIEGKNYTEEQILFNELNANISSLVSQLSSRCREVYLLSQEHGMNNKTISAKLLISEKTVEYHLYRAINFLRDNLQASRC